MRGLAERQQGLVTAAQLARLGVHHQMVGRWKRDGYLTKVLPRVYAVGHTAPSREAELWAAVLYAGPGAMLTGGTEAHFRGLIDYPPRVIEVSTPRKVRSLRGIRVHARRKDVERRTHNGLPVAPTDVMMLDLAAAHNAKVLKRALQQLDFNDLYDPQALLAATRRHGARGRKRLREAILRFDPQLKYANGDLEIDFFAFCKRNKLPLPKLNAPLHGELVDTYWAEAGLVVELDSELAHRSPAQRAADRRKDLKLRRHGLTVHRYDWAMVHDDAHELVGDIRAVLDRQQ
ncbi:MAG: hypothetical protein FWD04_00985 [Conexibacteraceae bacterium]|nr:hypothetical protein [Conexibacteraceae bacterium]